MTRTVEGAQQDQKLFDTYRVITTMFSDSHLALER